MRATNVPASRKRRIRVAKAAKGYRTRHSKLHRRVAGNAPGSEGLVEYCLHGTSNRKDISRFTPSRMVEMLRVGLPVQELDALQVGLQVPIERLGPMLGISMATLNRRKAAGKLDSAESDRVVRFARLMGKATEVLESEEIARQWLNSPQFGLGGALPLEYAETEVGAREVEDLLGRIEYGVYS